MPASYDSTFQLLFCSLELCMGAIAPMGVSDRVFHADSKYGFNSFVSRTVFEKRIYKYVACKIQLRYGPGQTLASVAFTSRIPASRSLSHVHLNTSMGSQ